MAEQQNATPPANSGGLTKGEVQAMLDEAVKPLIETTKILADTMAKLPPASAQAAPAQSAPAAVTKKEGEGDKPLTAADFTRMLDEKLNGFQQQQQTSAQRNAYIGEKLKGVPEVYHGKLGTDPTKWAAEEQAIRSQYQADLKAAGVKTADVGGSPGGAAAPAAADLSKLSPNQLLEMGLGQSKPVGPQGAPAQAGQASAAAAK